jgi:hypothetical protein
MAAEASSPAPDGVPEPERSDGPAVPGGASASGPGGADEPGAIQWIEGSADVDAGSGARDGLRWSWELDLGELLSAAGLVQAGTPDELGEAVDQEASLAAEQELIEASGGRGEGRDLTGRLAEHLPAGAGLAAWLAAGPAGEWSDWDLPGVAAAFRRVASWAQAGELAAVAAIASRTAGRDPKIGTGEDGRPGGLAPSAVAEVSLALSMSHVGASWWAGLGVALQWRLGATGRALAAGEIDVARARLVSEATAVLSDELAQEVEARILPDAGQQTTGQLRAALRRAVIAVDPRGADDRRRDAELQADVRLYADDAGTATLAAMGLPAVHGAAMMARLTALARGLRAGGAGGRLGLLKVNALAGLVLGTMPLTPAGPEAPTDPGPDDRADPGPGAPPDPGPGAPPDSGPGGTPPNMPGSGPPRPPGGAHRTPRPGPAKAGPARDGPGPNGPAEESEGKDDPADQRGNSGRDHSDRHPSDRDHSGRDHSGRDHSGPDHPGRDGPVSSGKSQKPTGSQGRDGPADPGESPASGPDPGKAAGLRDPAEPAGHDDRAQPDGPGGPADTAESWRDIPPPGDADMPPPRGEPTADPWVEPECDPYDIDRLAEDPAPAWPPLPATITQIPPLYGSPPPGTMAPGTPLPGTGPPGAWPLVPPGPAPGDGRPPPGRLDLTISWPALVGQSDTAATLSRIGPVTAAQALPLAVTAAADPHATWRVVLVGPDGRALAVEHIRRPRTPAPAGPPGTGPPGTGPPAACDPGLPPRAPGVTGRVTVTFPLASLGQLPPTTSGGTAGLPGQRHPHRDLARRHPRRRQSRSHPARRRRRGRLRPHRRRSRLPPPAAHPRARHRPRPDVPPAHLPPARAPRGHRPHDPLRPGRPHLHLQHRRPVPHSPPDQAGARLAAHPASPRDLPPHHSGRAHVHHLSGRVPDLGAAHMAPPAAAARCRSGRGRPRGRGY